MCGSHAPTLPPGLAFGTIGFVDTMKDPAQIDLISFMIGLLANDQDADRARR
jgi:hypothetical protein